MTYAMVRKVSALFALAFCFSTSGFADEAKVRTALSKAIPQLEIQSISESEIAGVYRVVDQRGESLFASADGTHFVSGELYSTLGGRLSNLSEQARLEVRVEKVAALKSEDKVTFPAKGDEKAHVMVFTDIDCGYCRKLHNEVPRMNELGITVSYLAFPRAGVGSSSYDKLVSVWCADDRLAAMTAAKSGGKVESKVCENPVADEYMLGNELGVNGTPAILLSDGTLVPGYVPAEQLAEGLGLM